MVGVESKAWFHKFILQNFTTGLVKILGLAQLNIIMLVFACVCVFGMKIFNEINKQYCF